MLKYICLGLIILYDTIFCCVMGIKLCKERYERRQRFKRGYERVDIEDHLPPIELTIERETRKCKQERGKGKGKMNKLKKDGMKQQTN